MSSDREPDLRWETSEDEEFVDHPAAQPISHAKLNHFVITLADVDMSYDKSVTSCTTPATNHFIDNNVTETSVCSPLSSGRKPVGAELTATGPAIRKRARPGNIDSKDDHCSEAEFRPKREKKVESKDEPADAHIVLDDVAEDDKKKEIDYKALYQEAMGKLDQVTKEKEFLVVENDRRDATRRVDLAQKTGNSIRAVMINKIKRLQFQRPHSFNENVVRTEFKTKYALIHVSLISGLAKFLRTHQADNIAIRRLVWELSVYLWLKVIPADIIYQALEVQVPEEYLMAAKELNADMTTILSLLNDDDVMPEDLRKDRQPLLFLCIFLGSILKSCKEYIAARQSWLLSNPTKASASRASVEAEISRIEKSWLSAIVDLEKVVLYLMDSVLFAEDLPTLLNPALFVASALRAAFIAMKMKVSGEASKIISSSWSLTFSKFESENPNAEELINNGVKVFFRECFNTTDQQLATHLFEYEQRQYSSPSTQSMGVAQHNEMLLRYKMINLIPKACLKS